MSTREPRSLEFKLEMPLEFDEEAFRRQVESAVYTVLHDFGGRSSGWSMSHGTLSRAEHYAAIAQHAKEHA